MKHILAIASSALLSMALFSGPAIGQSYPGKPVKVTTVSPGGALDTVLRIITQGISGPLGQPIVVENKASAIHPEDGIAKAAPDGYSLLYYANALWLAPFLRANLPYDPLRDFTPISLAVKGPNVAAVTATLPVNSVAELVALAKSQPGKLNVSVTGTGTSPHLAAVLFQSVSGAKMTEVRYKGTAQAFSDVAAGRVEVSFPTLLSALPFAKSGKIRMLAVTSTRPSPLAPDLPTVASLGYPGYESVAIQAFFAPPKTPAAIVNRLNHEIVRFLGQDDVKDKIGKMGFDIIASSPAQLGATMKSEMDRMGPVLREAGIRPK